MDTYNRSEKFIGINETKRSKLPITLGVLVLLGLIGLGIFFSLKKIRPQTNLSPAKNKNESSASTAASPMVINYQNKISNGQTLDLSKLPLNDASSSAEAVAVAYKLTGTVKSVATVQQGIEITLALKNQTLPPILMPTTVRVLAKKPGSNVPAEVTIKDINVNDKVEMNAFYNIKDGSWVVTTVTKVI